MATVLIEKQRTWSFERDDEGHRNYEISHLVECTGEDPIEGLASVAQTSGLPTIGSTWDFDGDIDVWAFCLPYMKITAHEEKEGEKPYIYRIDQKFTTKPYKRCQDTTIENPLLEPQKVSGTFEKYTREATMNKAGQPLLTSSKELHVGPKVEVDGNRPTVRIQQNVANLELGLMASMVGTVNDALLWDLPERCVKLSSASWERLVYGTCNFYYQRSFEFDIDYETFDKRLLDHSRRSIRSRKAHVDYGCTLSIGTGMNGSLSTVAVVSGGSGFPASSTFKLMVLKGAGKHGKVEVTTDASGVVQNTPISLIENGYGYPGGVSTAKTQLLETKLAADNIAKLIPPDPDDPTDHQAAKDDRGSNVKTLLDGNGLPATKKVIQYDVNGDPIAGVGSPYYKREQIYAESNMFLLGIPATF